MKKVLLIISSFLVFGSFAVAQVEYNAPYYHQFNTNYGHVKIGPYNTHFSHFETDRPGFYFNKGLCIGGNNKISSYSNSLFLEAADGHHITVKPHHPGYGLLIYDENNNDYLNMHYMKYGHRDGFGFAYRHGGYDLFIQKEGHVHLRKNLYLNTGGNIVIGGTQQGYNRFRIVSGDNTYIDYKDNLFFRADKNWISALTLYGNGTVGIGFKTIYTTGVYQNMGYKLAVNGGIVCEELKVIKDVPEADYVFDQDYNLSTLQEVEKYIKKNKHLPNIPSAKEFREAGYTVGEMDEMLLRKIEELTLYIIEQEKRIKELEKGK